MTAPKTRRPTKCPVCERRVAENADNWCPLTCEYVHTRCWFKLRTPAHPLATKPAAKRPAKKVGKKGGRNAKG